MDMPPAGWYPDPYGVPRLLRWWDGATWTQHTHQGSAPASADPGPATSLDATRVGAQPLMAGPGALGADGFRTARPHAVPQPTTVQPPVRPGEITLADPTAIQAVVQPGTAVAPLRAQPPGAQPRPALPGTGSSWPNAGPGGMSSSWPNGGPSGTDPYAETEHGRGIPPVQSDHGTQVLLMNGADWEAPTAPGGYAGASDGYGGPGGYGYDPGRRRRRLLLGGLLAGGTALTLALIGIVVSNLGSSAPPSTTVAQTPTAPATTSAPSPTATAAATATPTAAATPTVSAVPGGVTDGASGLSYSLLSAPWANGCPPNLSSQQTLTWTAGEAAPDGQVNSNGNSQNWFAEACSGPLTQQYQYGGVADLEPVATSLVNQFDGAYYGALNHQRTQLASTPVSVSGHPGWEIKYLMTYPNAASMGLAFNSEEGAVLVVDEGTGLPPAVFFASVPYNLNVAEVDALVNSLTLTVPQQPGQSASPSNTGGGGDNGGGGGGGNNP